MRTITSTYIHYEHKTNRVLCNRILKAMSLLCGYDNGTIRNPYELASSRMSDGRTLIETIYEDGECDYNDGWYIVDVQNSGENESYILVSLTGVAENDEIRKGTMINWIENIEC